MTAVRIREDLGGSCSRTYLIRRRGIQTLAWKTLQGNKTIVGRASITFLRDAGLQSVANPKGGQSRHLLSLQGCPHRSCSVTERYRGTWMEASPRGFSGRYTTSAQTIQPPSRYTATNHFSESTTSRPSTSVAAVAASLLVFQRKS